MVARKPRTPWPIAAFLSVLPLFSLGCSSLGGSSIPLGVARNPYIGGVSLHTMGVPPAGARSVGQVEVHGSEGEASLELLVPLFVAKVAELGGNAAVIERVDSQFQTVWLPTLASSFEYCGYRARCLRTRTVSYPQEVMTLVIRGQAWVTPKTPIDHDADPLALGLANKAHR
jgi:hypothetical protein